MSGLAVRYREALRAWAPSTSAAASTGPEGLPSRTACRFGAISLSRLPGIRHATALHREFYGPIGLEHQIAFVLEQAPDRVLAVALSRRHRDFTDAERELLDRARPFLIQAYRNAIEHTRLKELAEHDDEPRAEPLGGVLDAPDQ